MSWATQRRRAFWRNRAPRQPSAFFPLTVPVLKAKGTGIYQSFEDARGALRAGQPLELWV